MPAIDTSACSGGTAPPIETCSAGVFDADCGGTGEPVLAWALQFTDHWPHGEDCVAHTSGGFPGGRPHFASGDIVLTAEPVDGVALHGEATLVTDPGGTMTLRF